MGAQLRLVRLRWVWGTVVAVLAVLAATVVVAMTVAPARAPLPEPEFLKVDKREVTETVEAFVNAWRDADCAAYLAITTQREQERAGITDCAAFEERARAFARTVTDIEFAVTDIRGPDYQYTVTTQERFTVQRDPDDIQLSEPQHVTVEYSYDVVPHDDHWAILWWYETSACAYWSPVLTTQRGPECWTEVSS